jgi:hypothetical protein
MEMRVETGKKDEKLMDFRTRLRSYNSTMPYAYPALPMRGSSGIYTTNTFAQS